MKLALQFLYVPLDLARNVVHHGSVSRQRPDFVVSWLCANSQRRPTFCEQILPAEECDQDISVPHQRAEEMRHSLSPPKVLPNVLSPSHKGPRAASSPPTIKNPKHRRPPLVQKHKKIQVWVPGIELGSKLPQSFVLTTILYPLCMKA
jgi:hypothetical protein